MLPASHVASDDSTRVTSAGYGAGPEESFWMRVVKREVSCLYSYRHAKFEGLKFEGLKVYMLYETGPGGRTARFARALMPARNQR